MRVGFTCGTYDLLHAGHVISLKEAKEQCDRLVVGLQSDPTLDRKEKNKPIQSLTERLIQLKAIKYVDEVVMYTTEQHLHAILNDLNIDVRFLGEDWKGKEFTGHEFNKMEYVFQNRDHGYSSSELRRRVGMAEFENIHSEWKKEMKLT